MDPMQLQAMQGMSDSGFPGFGVGIVPGNMPGMLAPSGGISMFTALTDPKTSQFQSIVPGNNLPDTSPLAPFNLQQYGLPGIMAGMVGNTMLSNAMQRQGVLPYGNAGSYMQAYRTREHLQMRQAVSNQIASKDAESFYRTFRGAAALSGQPFNAEQRRAARSVSETMANFGPMLAGLAPDLMDAMAGERGSIQVLANQLTEANRYRIDPTTGRMGYSAETNKELISNLFDTMFSKDNMARMKGVRAGDIGQLYKELSSEGMVGLQGSLRDRTLNVLQEARERGTDLTALGEKAGVRIGATTELNTLSDRDLAKLRETGEVKSRLSKAEAGQISRQLQGYVDSIASIREIFGENGNPNAPMSQLINGLKALTSGQMQKFDATQLNNMVRDVQAMAQVSGKSIDQIVAMNQLANRQNAETLGRHGVYFDMAATRAGTTAGMAMMQQGAPVGFGALSRTETEQLAMQDYSRSLNSEMFNTLGALTRIEKRGGFAENQAGREMRSIMNALDAGASTYSYTDDAGKQVTKQVPLNEVQYRGLVSQGALKNMDTSDFNRELGYRTSNIRTMAENPNRQSTVVAQQANEINQQGKRMLANLFVTDNNLTKIKDVDSRKEAALSLGAAAADAIDSLPMDAITNQEKREAYVANAIKREAANRGITLNEDDAKKLAGQSLGEFENYTQAATGKDLTAHLQTKGKRVRQEVAGQDMIIAARSQQNQAMSGLGRQGSMMQRMFTALQKQGDRGTEATIQTFLTDALGGGADMAAEKLSKPMARVKNLNSEIENLTSQLSTATPEKRIEINKQIQEKSKELTTLIGSVKGIAEEFGLDDRKDTFNMTDIGRGRQATRELFHLNRQSAVAGLSTTSKVTDAELKAIAGTALTSRDFEIMASDELRNQAGAIEAAFSKTPDTLTGDYKKMFEQVFRNEGGMTEEGAMRIAKERMISGLGTEQQKVQEIRARFGPNATVGDIKSKEAKEMLVRERRASRELNPSMQQVTERADQIRKQAKLPARKTQAELDKMTDEQKKQYEENENILMRDAEDQLIAENQLKAIGELKEKDTLLSDPSTLTNINPELKKRLISKPANKRRSDIVSEYLDEKELARFTEKSKNNEPIEKFRENRRKDAVTQAESEGGKLTAAANEKNIKELSELRRAYLADPEAIKKGGMAALESLKQSQNAETQLTDFANKYYGGDLGKMLATPLATTAEGQARIQAEFADLQKEGKNSEGYKAVVDRLERAGVKFDKNNLTSDNYMQFLHLKNKDAVATMTKTVDVLTGAAQGKYADPRLSGLTKEQTKALDIMDKQLYGGVPEEAKKLGMTEEQYTASVRGTAVDPQSLILFKGPGADKQLQDAREESSKLNDAKKRLAQVEKELKTTPSEQAQREAENLKKEIATREGQVSKHMKAAGFDSTKPEDVEKYNRLLDRQGDVLELANRRRSYKEQVDQLKKSGLSDKDIEEKLKIMNFESTEVMKAAKDAAAKDLGSDAFNQLADSFGVKSAEERQRFKATVDVAGPAAERNRAMVANALKRVEGFKGLGDKDSTAIEKLDILSDEWSKAKTDTEKEALAKKYGTDVKSLNRMMSQTEFLGMAQKDAPYTAEDLRKSLEGVSGEDIAEKIKKEEERSMRITGGTLEVTGVVRGQGTFNNVTGTMGR